MIDFLKYTIVKDVLTKGKIEIGEGALKLFDIGDKVKWSFNVDQGGTYKIAIKLRTGDRNGRINQVSKYAIQVNDKPFATGTGAIGAQEQRFGISHWGELIGETRFEVGANSISVEALGDWLGVEGITITPVKLDVPIDYKALLQLEKIKADTLQVNFNSLQAKYDELQTQFTQINAKLQKILSIKSKFSDRATAIKDLNEVYDILEM